MATQDLSKRSNGNGETARARDITWLTPRADIYESDEEYLVVADLPGVERQDVSVELGEGRLVIETSAAKTGRTYHRTFTVPETMTSEGIVAKFDHGVLQVHLPKPPEQKPVRIAIG